jgi:hypothetical protein
MKAGMHVTKPLSSDGRRDTHTNRLMEEIHECAVEMGSGAILYCTMSNTERII